MIDFFTKYQSLIAILVGALLAWVIAGINSFWKIRRERKQILRQVLYDLIRTYYALLKFDLSELQNYIAEKIKARLIANGIFDIDEVDNELSKSMEVLKANFVVNIVLPELKKIDESLSKSIDELSKSYPILAFYLVDTASDTQKIVDGLGLLESIVKSIDSSVSMEEENKVLHKMLFDLSASTSIKSTKKNISNISFRIGPFTWFRSMGTVKSLVEKKSQTIKTHLDQIWDSLSNIG